MKILEYVLFKQNMNNKLVKGVEVVVVKKLARWGYVLNHLSAQ